MPLPWNHRQTRWLVLLLGAGCGAVPDPQPTEDPVFRITLEKGGGFTGLYSGYTLHSDGRLERWHQRSGGLVEIAWSQAVARDRIRALGQRLPTAGGTWTTDRVGNMTSRVHLTIGDSVTTWSWPGAGAPTEAPADFVSWHTEALALCREASDRRQDE
jgi:hypothetical protein